MQFSDTKMKFNAQRGMTLLELLVVIFILSSLAAVSFSIVESSDDHIRFEETKTRLAWIKRGILGDPTVTANKQPVISGFLADIGRLPHNLSELLEMGSLPEWQYYPETLQWAGWRGPYIEPSQETKSNGDPIRTFRDGWNNRRLDLETEEDSLFGWKRFETIKDKKLYIQSFGADNTEGGSDGYVRDYPLNKEDPQEEIDPLIGINDCQLDIDSAEIEVSIINNLPEDIDVRLRVLYPRNGHGTIPVLPLPEERDNSNDLSLMETIYVSPPPPNHVQTIKFKFAGPKQIPCGLRTAVLMKDGGEDDGKILNTRYDIPPIRLNILPRSYLIVNVNEVWVLEEPE